MTYIPSIYSRTIEFEMPFPVEAVRNAIANIINAPKPFWSWGDEYSGTISEMEFDVCCPLHIGRVDVWVHGSISRIDSGTILTMTAGRSFISLFLNYVALLFFILAIDFDLLGKDDMLIKTFVTLGFPAVAIFFGRSEYNAGFRFVLTELAQKISNTVKSHSDGIKQN